jgi:hypothetical protein
MKMLGEGERTGESIVMSVRELIINEDWHSTIFVVESLH